MIGWRKPRFFTGAKADLPSTLAKKFPNVPASTTDVQPLHASGSRARNPRSGSPDTHSSRGLQRPKSPSAQADPPVPRPSAPQDKSPQSDLSSDNEDFEFVSADASTHLGDFCEIDEDPWSDDASEYNLVNAAETPLRLPPGARAPTRLRVDQAVGAVASGALEGGAKAAKRAVFEGDLMTLLNPCHLAGKIFQGAFAGAVQTGYNVYQGASRLDHDRTIQNARIYLEGGLFSPTQRNLVQRWIDQARDRLGSWRKEHRNEDLTTMMALSMGEATGGAEKPPLVASSFKSVASATERENDAHNPPKKVMREQAKDLHDVLQALAAFTKLPRNLTYTSTREVLDNIAANPALGAKNFIDGLKTCAQGLARNPFKKTADKRIMLAISGPGTGKTTSIQTMTQWAGLPCAMLTGEDFNAMMALPHNKAATPYAVFTTWVAQAVLMGFGKSINGVILLDDFHKALEVQSDGALSQYPEDRKKFFEFLKLMGDAAQDAFITTPLADGHDLPLNMGDVHIIITMNRRPPELSSAGEEALLSRLTDLNAGYMSPADRTAYAQNLCDKLLTQIVHMGGTIGPQECQAARDAFGAIVAIDLDYYHALKEQLGQRGLCDMLSRFTNHIAARVTSILASSSAISGKTFDFAPDFDLAGMAAGIKDYEKVIDASVARDESRRKIQRGALHLRESLHALAPAHARTIERMLQKAENASEGNTWLLMAEKRLRDYTHTIDIISIEALETNLENQFSYLVGSAEEASPFDKMATVAQDIHRRIAATSKGLYSLLSENRPIQITWENPLGADPMLIHELAKAVGGVPVKVLDTADKLIKSTFLAQHTACLQHPAQVNAVRDKVFKVRDYETCVKSIIVTRQEVLYLRDRLAGTYHFCKEGGLTLLDRSNEGASLKLDDPEQFTQVDSIDAFLKRAQPQLWLFESILAGEESADQPLLAPSYAASFVLIKWSKTLEDAVGKWSDANHLDGDERDPEQSFLRYVQAHLNKPELELSDGRVFDPRALTVFVEGSGKPIYMRAREGETVLPWTIPVLPKAGRRRYAAAFLQENLANLRQKALDNEKIFGVRHVAELNANDDDEQALARLIAHDEAIYERSKTLHYPLSLEALKDGVRWLADAIEARATAATRKRTGKSKVCVTQKRWDEYYLKDKAVLDAIDEERRSMAEREALRQRLACDPPATKAEKKPKKKPAAQASLAPAAAPDSVSDASSVKSKGKSKGKVHTGATAAKSELATKRQKSKVKPPPLPVSSDTGSKTASDTDTD